MRAVIARIILLGGLLFAGPAGAAESKLLNIELARDEVDITSGFTGADITLFGVKQGRGDVVVVLEGPRKGSTVWRKSRVMGAWVNKDWANFKDIPLYYDYAVAVEDVKKILSKKGLEKSRIGLDALSITPEDGGHGNAERVAFEEAMVRIKQKRALFPIKPQKVVFLDDRFFRADFHLPANVPKGDYVLHGMLVRDGRVVAEVSRTMTVAQVGLSADINSIARKHGLAYGFMCVFLAFLAGFVSDLIVRRN